MVNLSTQPTLLLYRNIENANEIRAKIMEATLHCAVLKPRYVRTIVSSQQFTLLMLSTFMTDC
jgi:hypothetical protein